VDAFRVPFGVQREVRFGEILHWCDVILQVANVLEKELRKNGWEVLRPDRDAPQMQWEEYLNWVSKQV
jgi:hypothetical protein